MSAPLSAFRNKTLKATSGSNTIDCLVAIPDETKEVLKARFYLDEILAVDEYDSAGNRIAGFIGACYVGSQNHAMHNANRRFTLDATRDGQMDFFNDAGLNTLGTANWTDVPLVQYANYIIIPSAFISAYWVDSNAAGERSLGYQIRKFVSGQGPDVNWLEFTIGSLPRNSQRIENVTLMHYIPVFEEGDSLEARAFIKNAEGTFYSPILGFNVNEQLEMYRVRHGSGATCSGGGNNVEIIITEPYTHIYKGVDQNGALIPADSGWYFGHYTNAQQREQWLVGSNGLVTSKSNCPADPIPDPDLNFPQVRLRRSFPHPVTGEFTITLSVHLGTRIEPNDLVVTGVILEGAGPGATQIPFTITVPAGASTASKPIAENVMYANIHYSFLAVYPDGFYWNDDATT